MKVLLISNMYPSQKDLLFGIFIRNFKEELERQDVIFVKSVLIKGRTNSLIGKLFVYFGHYLKAIFYFVFSKYEIIYIHYLSHHLPLLLFIVIFKRRPVVINVHGSDIIDIPSKGIINLLARFVLKRIDLLVVPTSYFRELVLSRFPFIPLEKLTISPSGGIDGSIFYKKNELHQNDILVIGFVSRFIEEKGWKTYLDAAIELKDRKIAFRCLIAGQGPDEQAILTYIREHDLSAYTKFLGFVPQHQLVDVYNQCTLYVFPTYRAAESLGLTGLEAMACGVPVIGCNVAGPATYVREEYNGYLFPPKNATILAEKILSYNSLNTKDRAQLSQNAQHTAAEYKKERIARKLLDRLEELVP